MSGRVHIWSVGFLLMAVSFFSGCSEPERGKPNIILIIADDLGYGDTGPYGQSEIETPNIDRLAAEGLRFTHFYAGSPVCAPSRCVLLTGMHTGHSQVRGNDEWEERGDVWSYRAMIADSTLEGQKPLAESTVTIASLLQRNGYITGAVGKWALVRHIRTDALSVRDLTFSTDTTARGLPTLTILRISGAITTGYG